MMDPSLTFGPADLAPRARIREAALRLYAEHGEQATSIRRVADEANMSPGAVMHHFKSKDELTEAVQHAVVATIRQAVSGVGLDQPPPAAGVGLVLYRAINLAHIVFGPLIEQMLGLSLSDPIVLERFSNAAIDLLTRPVFNEAPPDGPQ